MYVIVDRPYLKYQRTNVTDDTGTVVGTAPDPRHNFHKMAELCCGVKA